MIEITSVILENEMDLILAHKQSMRLAELAGLSLSVQTSFATAVSEVSRSAIGGQNRSSLGLYVSDKAERQKFITAVLEDRRTHLKVLNDDGFIYAKRLVSNINATTGDDGTRIELNCRIPLNARIDDGMVEKWRIQLNTDPAVSPYEEIKRKNRQLIEMADRLRESEQQYKALTDSLPIMIFTMNGDGTITYANQWVEEYSGQTITEINNTRWKDLLHPDDFDAVWATWDGQTGAPPSVRKPERRLKNGNSGEYRWHTGVSIAMANEEGHVKSWNNFMVDIHAQKMIEETLKDNKILKQTQVQLEEKVELLHQSNEQLERFAYVASHDLQEPLRKISFYSDFIQKRYGSALPEEARLYFNNLVAATDRMRILIQDILAYSTVRKERFTPVDLNEVAKEAVQDLEISIKDKNASIFLDVLPSIEGNRSQLKQLFENLISNALKFSKPDIDPSVSLTAVISEGRVVLSFTDEGIGFEEQYIGKMFDLFQKLHTRDKYSGTGIGLAICKKIVDLHKGTIVARGELGKGSTFDISLPLLQPTAPENNYLYADG